MVIVPTVGRIVWYWSHYKRGVQPLAAIVTFVHNDRLVDLTAFDYGLDGRPFSLAEVRLRQPEDEANANPYCEWMPYQVGQAQRAKAAERERVALEKLA